MDNEEYDLLMNFSQGNVEKNIQYVIKKYKIDYLVVSSSQAAKALNKSGYELIQIDKDNKLFLLHKS